MGDDGWVAEFRRTGGRYAPEITDDAEPGTKTFRYAVPNVKLDLDPVPDGLCLIVELPHVGSDRSLEISNARAGHYVVIRQRVPVKVASGRLGTVEFQPHSRRATFEGTAERLEVHKVEIYIKDGSEVTDVLVVDGELTGTTDGIDRIELCGEVNIPKTKHVEVATSGAAITIDGVSLDVERLVLPATGDRPSLEVKSRESKYSVSTFRVETVTGAQGHLRLDRAALELTDVADDLFVTGSGQVGTTTDSTVTDLTLTDDVVLHASAGSALQRFGGQLRVGSCANASIVAAPGDSYTFVGAEKKPRTQNQSPRLEGATLRGVLVEDGAHGRQLLQRLREAAVIEPTVGQLRVRSAQWRVPFARRRLTRDTRSLRDLDDAAFFAQELAGLVDEKCGSGSIRTKTSWAAYRGRHLTAPSVWERAALGLFRLVGYGQRPGPPALAWIIAAMLGPVALIGTGSWPSAALFSWEFTGEFTRQVVNFLLSPLVLLRLAGDPQVSDISQTGDLVVPLVRTAVAAPFVFLVIAVGRFLRADWPW